MRIWIDKQVGSHYHKEDCSMAKDPHYHYGPVERRIRKYGPTLSKIRCDGKFYYPCRCIYKEIFKL